MIDYRKKNEDLMELYAKAKMPTKYGEFEILTFVNKITKQHHVVLTMEIYQAEKMFFAEYILNV